MANRGQGVTDTEAGMVEAGLKLELLNGRVQVTSEGSNRVMKLVSLMLLTPHYAVLILLMRYVRTRSGPMFVTSTTVVLSEVTKTVTCLFIILAQHKGSLRAWAEHLREFLLSRPRDFLKVCLPSFLFVLQNNLIFVAISNLDAATFQVTYQLKILTTAVFSVLLLGKRLSVTQWISLMFLFAGVSLIQVKSAMGQSGLSSFSPLKNLSFPNPFSSSSFLPPAQLPSSSASASASASVSAAKSSALSLSILKLPAPESTQSRESSSSLSSSSSLTAAAAGGGGGATTSQHSQNHFTGLLAVLACCCLSGFANVFFELLLKGGKQSVWVRNIQLGLSGTVLSVFACLVHDGVQLRAQGFFYGYDELVWMVILLQSVGGLLVAAVIKYADNILKGFSTAGSILLSCVASVYIFDFQMDTIFMMGTSLVLLSLYLYNLYPAQQPNKNTYTLEVEAPGKPTNKDSNGNVPRT